jgi:glycine cleavage system H protein
VRAVVTLLDNDFPDDLLYDIANQIWYRPLDSGVLRAGFTSWAARLMGEVLVFTPKRLGRDFEKGRSFAVVEGGKWVGSARSAFDGIVVSHNPLLVDDPSLLNSDSYGNGWMLTVRPTGDDWNAGLVTGDAIRPAFEAWSSTGAFKDRTG